jgi:drug/metabolite transporter (DMT)-like permease
MCQYLWRTLGYATATVQLSVPIIAALGGIFFLEETVSARLIFASLAITDGITLIIMEQRFGA